MLIYSANLRCGAAMAYVSPDGILYPCLNWRDPIDDLKEL